MSCSHTKFSSRDFLPPSNLCQSAGTLRVCRAQRRRTVCGCALSVRSCDSTHCRPFSVVAELAMALFATTHFAVLRSHVVHRRFHSTSALTANLICCVHSDRRCHTDCNHAAHSIFGLLPLMSSAAETARADVLSLQLSTLRLEPDAPQLHELAWHPTKPMLAAADVQGTVSLYQMRKPAPRSVPSAKRPVSTAQGAAGAFAAAAAGGAAAAAFGGHVLAAQLTHHTDACRSVTFHPSGNFMYTASADKSIG
jgi:WD40 repeat protein